MLTLKELSLDQISVLIKSIPKDVKEDCEIIGYIGSLPGLLLRDLESVFFTDHFKLDRNTSQNQYYVWYSIFLQKGTVESRFY